MDAREFIIEKTKTFLLLKGMETNISLCELLEEYAIHRVKILQQSVVVRSVCVHPPEKRIDGKEFSVFFCEECKKVILTIPKAYWQQ